MSMVAPQMSGIQAGAPRTFWWIRVKLICSLPPKPRFTRLKIGSKPRSRSSNGTRLVSVFSFVLRPSRTSCSSSIGTTIFAKKMMLMETKIQDPSFGRVMVGASRKLVNEKTSKLRFLDILSTGGINLKHMLSHSRTHTHTYTPSLSHTHPSIHSATYTRSHKHNHTHALADSISVFIKLSSNDEVFSASYFQSSQKLAQCEVCTGSLHLEVS